MITARKMLMLGAVALIVAAGTAAAASAQIEQTPKNYPYYLKDGKPVGGRETLYKADSKAEVQFK